MLLALAHEILTTLSGLAVIITSTLQMVNLGCKEDKYFAHGLLAG